MEKLRIFNKILMRSETDNAMLKTCFYQEDGEDAACFDGALVSIKEVRDHDLYIGMKDLNARNCTAYDADAPIYGFVDYVDVDGGNISDVRYRIGDKLYNVQPEAGVHMRVRMVEKGDEFYLGNGCFDVEPEAGKFAVPEAGKCTMKVVDSIDKSGLCIEIEDARDLIVGQINEGHKMYRCRVVSQ